MAAPARGWALVTGAARRIGAALAIGAAQAGYGVVLHTRSGDPTDTAEAIAALGGQSVALKADLADPAQCAGLIAAAPAPLRLLVNSASLFDDDALATLTSQALDTAFAVNLRAPILLTQAFAAGLPADETGLVVNLIDQKVLHLDPRQFSYSVSKAGLWGATRMMAQALAPRIRVNAIGPGPTLPNPLQSEDTFAAEVAGTLLAEAVGVDQIALALRYLIDARAVTGQMIAVDAGQHLGWRTPDVIDP
jgi:NAD(P)-dependent dehydrogenase (short-subunit alcohol dehydrogenase family)